MDFPMNLNLDRMLPEFIVAGTGLAAILPELLLPVGRRAIATAWTSALGLIIAFLVLWLAPIHGGHALSVTDTVYVGGQAQEVLLTGWSADTFSVYCRGVVLLAGALLVLMSMAYTRRMDRGHGEFYALLLFALLGVLLCAGVSDLLSFFICLELVTISAFILAAFKRNDLKSTEAGLKYLVIGAASTALLLLGVAFVYGHVGSLSFEAISASLASGPPTVFLVLGVAMVLGGLLFKIGGVPFHVWIPDVYQGAPTPVTGFLASASKAAGLILLMRFAVVALGASANNVDWVPLLSVVAGVTLVIGSLGAMGQLDIKRMMAYSGLGHAGYLLMGVAAMAASGAITSAGADASTSAPTALLFYMLAYAITTVAAFAVIVLVSGASRGQHGGAAYRGLWKRSPFLALALCLALLSLAGVPPMSGFFAKFLVLRALVDHGMYVLAFLGAAAVVAGLYFYFLWIRAIYFKPPDPDMPAARIRVGPAAMIVLVVGIVAMLGMGVYPGPFYDMALEAAKSLVAAR